MQRLLTQLRIVGEVHVVDMFREASSFLSAAAMRDGGLFGVDAVPWFNGGLFKTIDVPPLTAADLQALYRAASDMDWRAIDPTIFEFKPGAVDWSDETTLVFEKLSAQQAVAAARVAPE